MNVWNIGGITSVGLYQVRMKPSFAVSCSLHPLGRSGILDTSPFPSYPLLRRYSGLNSDLCSQTSFTIKACSADCRHPLVQMESW